MIDGVLGVIWLLVHARCGKWKGSAVPAIEGKHNGGNVDEMGDHWMNSASSTVSMCRRYRCIEA